MSLQPTVAPIVRADTRSFPPTGQPLTIINEASAGQASYGGGGGGGGGSGPVGVFSTIVMGDSGGNVSIIDVTATQTLCLENGGTNAQEDIVLFTNSAVYGQPATGVTFLSPGNLGSLTLIQKDDGTANINALNYNLGTGNAFPSTLSIEADNVIMSSITASTISTSILTFPNSAAFVGTGVVMDTNLTINDVNNANQSDFMFVANQPEGLLGNSSTNAILINAPAGLGATLSLKAANNSTSMIIASDNTLALAPLELAASSVNISSLNVSSINGASPGGGGGGGLTVSTISVGGSAQTFYSSISTNSSAQISQPFDIAIGHYYNLKWDYSIAPTVTAGLNDYTTFNFGGGLTQGHHTAPLAFSSITQGQLNFVANGNITTYLQVETNTTTPCELNLGSAIDNIILTDFGSL